MTPGIPRGMEAVDIGGATLAVVDRGAGPPLVLVHGFPLDHSMWNEQILVLSEHYRVIAPDLRGFGYSELTHGTVTMNQMADDTAAMLDVLGIAEPVTFCGLSMGGYVAWQFWNRHAARLRGLILCDTRAVGDTPEVAADRHEMAERVLREGPGPLVETMMPKLFAESTVREQPDVVEALRSVMLGNDPIGIAAAGRGMAVREDFTPRLPEIQCPALVLVGQHDAISTPDEMASIARALPHARFVEIAGSGHMSPMERPEEVNRAMAGFLATVG